MVKKNLDRNSIDAPSVVLEEKDKEKINKIMDSAPVDLKKLEIINPINDDEGLYFLISSTEREDLYDDKTMNCLKSATGSVGYDGSKMDRGNFPSQKTPNRFDKYEKEYYTISIWFTNQR